MKSQQLKWQERQRAIGRCPQCGSEDRAENYILCRKCVKKQRMRNKARKSVDKVKTKFTKAHTAGVTANAG